MGPGLTQQQSLGSQVLGSRSHLKSLVPLNLYADSVKHAVKLEKHSVYITFRLTFKILTTYKFGDLPLTANCPIFGFRYNMGS